MDSFTAPILTLTLIFKLPNVSFISHIIYINPNQYSITFIYNFKNVSKNLHQY